MKKIYSLETDRHGTIYVVKPSARAWEGFIVNQTGNEQSKNWSAMADVVSYCLVTGPEDDTRLYASKDELLDGMDADEYFEVAPRVMEWVNSRLEPTLKNLPEGDSSRTNSPSPSDTPA